MEERVSIALGLRVRLQAARIDRKNRGWTQYSEFPSGQIFPNKVKKIKLFDLAWKHRLIANKVGRYTLGFELSDGIQKLSSTIFRGLSKFFKTKESGWIKIGHKNFDMPPTKRLDPCPLPLTLTRLWLHRLREYGRSDSVPVSRSSSKELVALTSGLWEHLFLENSCHKEECLSRSYQTRRIPSHTEGHWRTTCHVEREVTENWGATYASEWTYLRNASSSLSYGSKPDRTIEPFLTSSPRKLQAT